jgi:hypothetical protein
MPGTKTTPTLDGSLHSLALLPRLPLQRQRKQCPRIQPIGGGHWLEVNVAAGSEGKAVRRGRCDVCISHPLWRSWISSLGHVWWRIEPRGDGGVVVDA